MPWATTVITAARDGSSLRSPLIVYTMSDQLLLLSDQPLMIQVQIASVQTGSWELCTVQPWSVSSDSTYAEWVGWTAWETEYWKYCMCTTVKDLTYIICKLQYFNMKYTCACIWTCRCRKAFSTSEQNHTSLRSACQGNVLKHYGSFMSIYTLGIFLLYSTVKKWDWLLKTTMTNFLIYRVLPKWQQ